MAKRKKTPAGQLGNWLDEVPKVVQEAADVYDKAHMVKTKAREALNTAKETLIERMRANGINKVRIRNAGVPNDLRSRISERLEDDPSIPWDQALAEITEENLAEGGE